MIVVAGDTLKQYVSHYPLPVFKSLIFVLSLFKNNMKKLMLIAAIGLSLPLYSTGQCWNFIIDGEKWGIYAESNVGGVLGGSYGKGSEFGYGGGIEWRPFKKILYFEAGIKNARFYLKDDSPDPTIYPTAPYDVNKNSSYLRSMFGAKLRFGNELKLSVGAYFFYDKLLSEYSELKHPNSIVFTSEQFSKAWYAGKYLEAGVSAELTDHISCDINAYVYDAEEASAHLFEHGDSKLGIGLSLGFYLHF